MTTLQIDTSRLHSLQHSSLVNCQTSKELLLLQVLPSDDVDVARSLVLVIPGAGFIEPAYDVVAGDNSSKA